MKLPFRILIVVAACTARSAFAVDAADIKPRAGLTLSSTVAAVVNADGNNFGFMDHEEFVSLSAVKPEGLDYSIAFAAATNQQFQDIARKYRWPRHVRHEDLEDSSRMTLLVASNDPEVYAGQTFAETSRRVLNTLRSGGEVAFVVGVYEPAKNEAGAGASPMPGAAAKPAAASAPAAAPLKGTGAAMLADMSQLLQMKLGSARHYYRGTLRRVEPQTVPVSVLVNGERTTVPAIHASGMLSFADGPAQKADFWWLDNPDWPVTLRWSFAGATTVVTHINWVGEGGGDLRLRALTDHDCHVELHGIYFNSGSAALLEESEPMLKQVAALVNSSPAGTLTIEGHTDNIGSAPYNQLLSAQRAAAVREALVSRYGVAPARLVAAGYGLTRPVETNATIEGRARNRRVELSRPCATH